MFFLRPDQTPETGINPYDVRLSCDPATQGGLCYEEFSWIDKWMNQASVKKALGVDLDRNFETCSPKIEEGFILNGDAMHNSGTLLQELVDGGVRLLVYSGNAGKCRLSYAAICTKHRLDIMCNYIVGMLRSLSDPRIDCSDREGSAGWRS